MEDLRSTPYLSQGRYKKLSRIMSGIEVAGLVLGAIPIVISALQSYKAGQGPIASLKKRCGPLLTLIDRLQDARCVFAVKLETLLLAAGIWINNGQSLQNEDDCMRILMKKRVARKLKRYLRSYFDNFLSVVRRYEICLKTIAAALVNIQRLPNVSVKRLVSYQGVRSN